MKIIINTFIIISLIITGCLKDADDFDIQNLNGNDIMILGHRGMGEMYKHPGNTYEGIIPVFGIGADGTEMDVQMTKDSVLVLFHDKDMKLTTTCEGAIYDYTWPEIGGCEYHCLVQNVYIITLDNLFSRIQDLRKYYFSFDCKLAENVEDRAAYMAIFLEK
ncbi:MAG: glycerophosphodiester phosphodiesterase family protein, partial [Bacteroidota bacterium]